MTQVTLLRDALRPHLAWHGARLSFVATFLIALFRVKTVNLSELVTGFSGSAQIDSHYKRLQRFFRDFEMDYTAIGHTVVALMDIPQPWVLSLDRTEWQFGECTFNILMLGVVHEGIAFPVMWCLLDKRGNSNTSERMTLFQQFLQRFPARQVAYLTADREFVGQDWFCYLQADPRTPFRIRIRENHKLDDGRRNLKVQTVFQDLQPGQHRVLRHKRLPKTAIVDYANRWGIETLFGIFKTRGFCLESTHLQSSERLSKLLALLTLALCWAVLTGKWLYQLKPLKLKKHGRKVRSLFRYGFDHLRSIVLNVEQKLTEFVNALQILSCT
jgi:hypothetical protein